MRISTQAASGAGKLSIGALARATGIPVETLRTWEHRYGFPVAERRASGHRTYAVSLVPRLRRIADLLARGHRAGAVVPATDAELDRLQAVSAGAPAQTPSPSIPLTGSIEDVVAAVAAFDTERVTAMLLGDWARLGPIDFLRQRAAPLVERVGGEWAAGHLNIRHEHFLSERLGDMLRSMRMSFDHQATGPVVICATLPGEQHALGLQMAALVLAAAGWRVVYLGTNVPVTELTALTKELRAAHVALSVSSAADARAVRRDVRRLRRSLPEHVAILAGGAGAASPMPAGVTVIGDFGTLHAWAVQSSR
jgi:MerR family transcriptional regulator, light-induced transcriptional regulator